MKRGSALLFACIFLISCGTHDYESPPPETRPVETIPLPRTTRAQGTPQTLIPKSTREGYLWRGMRGVGVSDANVESLMCTFQDGLNVDRLKAFGAALMGGAILGIVIRTSGSWFFGEPVKPGPKHWFWRNIDTGVKTLGQGALRGALFGAACETLLTGGDLLPIDGILGQNFSAISVGATLGAMSSVAAAPFARRWLEFMFNRGPNRIYRNKGPVWNGVVRIKKWSKSSDIGKGIRYRVLPNLAIIGVGFGVGVLVYDSIQDGGQDGNHCIPPLRIAN